MKKQKISDAVIHRLPRYYRYLDDLYNKGVVRISSNSLGAKMDITASQIRQDLSCFGEFGQQGYGYNVAVLTVPQSVAQPLADRLIGLGVRGFWNFTNVELSTKEDGVFFEDIHFVDTLLTLSYRISQP